MDGGFIRYELLWRRKSADSKNCCPLPSECAAVETGQRRTMGCHRCLLRRARLTSYYVIGGGWHQLFLCPLSSVPGSFDRGASGGRAASYSKKVRSIWSKTWVVLSDNQAHESKQADTYKRKLNGSRTREGLQCCTFLLFSKSRSKRLNLLSV